MSRAPSLSYRRLRPLRSPMAMAALLCGLTPTPRAAHGQDPESLCADADRHLRQEAMATVVEADTIDDWRTGEFTPGCRVTAAGVTGQGLRQRARRFFDDLRDAGWERSPDPRDAPGEASLRFRREAVDCLFSFYAGGLLGTEAEVVVDDQRVPPDGELRFNVLVLCVPAQEALPRGGASRPRTDHAPGGEESRPRRTVPSRP